MGHRGPHLFAFADYWAFKAMVKAVFPRMSAAYLASEAFALALENGHLDKRAWPQFFAETADWKRFTKELQAAGLVKT
jgi:hypothetical protein